MRESVLLVGRSGRRRRRLRALATSLRRLLPLAVGPFLRCARLNLEQQQVRVEMVANPNLEQQRLAEGALGEVSAVLAVWEHLLRPLQRKRPREATPTEGALEKRTRMDTVRVVTRVEGGGCLWPLGLGLGQESARLALIVPVDESVS